MSIFPEMNENLQCTSFFSRCFQEAIKNKWKVLVFVYNNCMCLLEDLYSINNKCNNIVFGANVAFECNSLISCVLVLPRGFRLYRFFTHDFLPGAYVLHLFCPVGRDLAFSNNSPGVGPGDVNSWN